jgi:hypothetical protein
MKTLLAIAAVALLASTPDANAQWQKSPRARSGEFDLTARAPKTRAGRPDLSGVWLADRQALPKEIVTVEGDEPFPRHMINVAADLKPEDVAFQPWAAELFQQRMKGGGGDDPSAHCKPHGVPGVNANPLPFKIVQTDNLILLLYEEDTVFRQVFLDGRKPVEDAVPRYMGYSTGRWEGATLVVDTVGLNDMHQLDGMGHPQTEKLHLTERLRRIDSGHLSIEITIDDPGAYQKPFAYTVTSTLVPDEDLLEYFCSDNEKDAQHYQ